MLLIGIHDQIDRYHDCQISKIKALFNLEVNYILLELSNQCVYVSAAIAHAKCGSADSDTTVCEKK